MSLKLEHYIASPTSAPLGASVHRLVSLTEEKIAFKVVCEKPQYYEIHPLKGFIDSGEVVRLIARPRTSRFPSSKIMVKWVEADDDEDDIEMALKKKGRRCGHIIHQLHSKSIYDDERYPSALLKSYVDPWAEERRPWLLLKFGYSTVAIRNEDLIWKATEKVTNELSGRGIFLEKCPLYYSLSCLQEKQIAEELRHILQDIRPDIYPVLLLVDDCNGKFAQFVKARFAKRVYIFTLNGQEVVDIAHGTDERSCAELSDWCSEFASLIKNSEIEAQFPSSSSSLDSDGGDDASSWEEKQCGSAYRFHECGNARPWNHQSVYRDCTPDEAFRACGCSSRSGCRTPGKSLKYRDPPSDWHHASLEDLLRSTVRAPCNHRQGKDDHYSEHDKHSDKFPHLYGRPLSEAVDSRNRLSDDSHLLSGHGCDIDNRKRIPVEPCDDQNKRKEDFGKCIRSYLEDEEIATAHDVELALDYVETNRSDPDIVSYVAVPHLFNRLKTPFQDMPSNISLMRLIHICCSVEAEVEEVNSGICSIIESLISSSYIQTICNWFGYPAVQDTSLWNQDLCNMFVVIMNLFLLADKYGKNGEEACNAWRTFYGALSALPEEFWSQVPERNWMEEMAMHLMPRSKDQQSCVLTEEQQTPNSVPTAEYPHGSESPTKTSSNEPSPPLWKECEKRAPPYDFRSLSETPTKEDVYHPEPSYLRRAIVEGHYENAGHYLDVQFRLFREDLVSPLRDGIAVYRINGSRRYWKPIEDEDQPISDLLIFGIEGLEGLQVRPSDGTLCRYAKLTAESRSHPALSRNLMFGQMVCLSSDGFEEDLLLAKIVERDKTDDEGVISFSIMNDDETVVKNRPYQIAEPGSYLVAYQHVLRSLKNISPYKPIPFEQYIVYGSCDVRKPLYMRMDEEVEDILKDCEMTKYYEDARRDIKSKISKDWKPFDNSDQQILSTSIAKKKVGVINEYELQRIKIGDQVLEIDKLQEDYPSAKLDESQRQAVVQALISELAIIQGPPGTGKTFVGVELARIMLQNRTRWGITEPMLIIAFTNSAVDQFLEKLFKKVQSDIVEGYITCEGPIGARLGSKSESDLLKGDNFLKNDVVKEWSTELNTANVISELDIAFKAKREAQQALAEASLVLYMYKRNLLSYRVLCRNKTVPPRFRLELETFKKVHCDSSGHELDDDETFACWLLDKVYNKDNERATILPSDDEEEIGGEPCFLPKEINEVVSLDKLLEDMNRIVLDEGDDSDELYLTEHPWDIAKEAHVEKNVVLMGGEYKEVQMRRKGSIQRPLDSTLSSECEEATESILKVKPLRDEDTEDIKSIFSLTKQRRWELYMYWMLKTRESIRQRLPVLIENYRSACECLKKAQLEKDVEVLRKCLVIGATTTGAAKDSELLAKIQCRVLLVEEAAEVLEAHTLASLVPSVEHMVLIGDHQQLRPKTCVYELAREYHLDVSMFERLVQNGFPYTTLKVQHRMNTDITKNIVRPYFYPDITDSDSVMKYPPVPGMDKSCFFWMHEVRECTTLDATSRWNDHEVRMVVGLISYLMKQGIGPDEITVLAAYSAQTMLLREAVANAFSMIPDETVSVQTVDSFQGKENRIIIVSLVRSEMDGIGFLAVKNRITVALTRARHGMFVVANFGYLSECSSFWNKICNTMFENDCVSPILKIRCRLHGNVQEIKDPNEFHEKSPEGGCQKICEAALSCGHTCPRRCHPIDDHLEYSCLQPCVRKCKEERFRHLCHKLCSEVCGPCMDVVTIRLECGHLTNVVCSSLSTAACGARCEKTLKCGHQCSNTCGKSCTIMCQEDVVLSSIFCSHIWTVPCQKAETDRDCPMPCQKMLSCGHTCAEICGQTCTVLCKAKVTRLLSCGHSIILACCEDLSEKKCQVLLERNLERCGHLVMIPCHAGADSSYCPVICGKDMSCGHQCLKTCGECFVAGGCKCEAVCGKTMKCGHKCTKKCGEQCGPCFASCLSSCKHQDCGSSDRVQTIKYGRNCSQLCALCPRFCDNSCQHRSCGKRCYEVCDVKPCEEPCTLRLMCGHACLGMCGEQCPSICGICTKQTYISIISEYLGACVALTKVPRVIEIQGCRHAFPVEFLDKHMMLCQESSAVPVCPYPGCDVAIVGIHRYAKIVKKQNLEKYYQKVTSTTASGNMRTKMMNGYWNTVQKELKDCKKAQQKVTGKITNQDLELVNTVVDILASSERSLAKERLARAELCSYWREFTKCTVLLSRLTRSFVTNKFVTKSTPNVRNIFTDIIPRGNIQRAFKDELRQFCNWLTSYGETRLNGVVFPRARYLAVRCMFFSDLVAMDKHCSWEARDLQDIPSVEVIQTKAKQFLSASSEASYLQMFDDFEQVLISSMTKIGLGGRLETRKQRGLEIPEF